MRMTEPPETPGVTERGFGGLRVAAFETRLAEETARLIAKAGGVAISAPSMKEVPLAASSHARAFADDLLAGRFDIVVFLTGVGTRYLFEALEPHTSFGTLATALTRTTVVARGPKPVAALRERGIPVAITVPEPNTWRELVATLEESELAPPLAGSRIALQEYGTSNPRLIEALSARGAEVVPVQIYRWALPDDTGPLEEAIRHIVAGNVDVALFTSATQARHLFEVARRMGLEQRLRRAMRGLCVCSIGPVCTEALLDLGIAVDLEPPHPKLGFLVRAAAEQAAEVLARKRRPQRPARAVEPTARRPEVAVDVRESVFLKACRREPTPYTPVWLMRQAGRYMQEYRELRARMPFIELCKTPELAAEAAVTAVRRLGTDAAILFSDILLILQPMGLELEYVAGEGPSLGKVIRTPPDVERLQAVDPADALSYVLEAVRITRRELEAHIPLIGFSGAPFTLASYAIEGGGSRTYTETKRFMYTEPSAWDRLMERLTMAVRDYLLAQIEAGCQAVQVFDSWVGCLAPHDYRRYVLPHMRSLLSAMPQDVPVIHFGTDTATLLDLQLDAGGSVLGIDHRVAIDDAFARFGARVAIQGNLDPVVLLTNPSVVRREAERILREVGGRNGHIFNLGHGILPMTPVDHVVALVDAVHELSEKRSA